MLKLIAATAIAAILSLTTPAHADDEPKSQVDGFGRAIIVGDSIAWDYAPNVRAPGGVPAINRAIPGTCLFLTDTCWRPKPGTLIQRLRRMEIDPRDTVVIAIGINDLYRGRMSQFSRGYREAVRYVEGQGATVLVATITPYSGHMTEGRKVTDALRVRVNDWLMRSGLPVLDLSSVMGGDHMPSRYDAGDGLHPNRYGRRLLAEAVTEALHQS